MLREICKDCPHYQEHEDLDGNKIDLCMMPMGECDQVK